jgi:hypothetical protein
MKLIALMRLVDQATDTYGPELAQKWWITYLPSLQMSEALRQKAHGSA